MSEERIKVLEMLADGKITIDQANQLMEALSGAGESAPGKRYEKSTPHESTTTILEPQQTPPQQDFNGFTFDQVIAMGTVGVKPEFVHKVHEAGLTDLSFNQIIEMGTVGVEPEFVLKVREAGLTDLTFDQIIQMGTVGVEPEFVLKVREAGLTDLTFDQIIQMGTVGVQPEFVRGMLDTRALDLTKGQDEISTQ